MMFSPKHIPTKYLFGLGLFLAVVLAYFPVLFFEFVNYDDNIHVYANPYILDFSWEHFSRFWLQPHLKLYIPLTYSVWGGLAKVSALFSGGGPNPAVYHTVNLLLHGVNAILVFAILRCLFKVEGAAFFGALVFALHPVQAEAVAWVSGLKDVLSGFFLLAALWLYVLQTMGQNGARQRGWLLFGGATVMYMAALLCKPNTVVLPFIAGIIGVVLHKKRKALLREMGLWLLLALPVILITRSIQHQASFEFQPAFWQRVLVAGDALSFYFAHLLFPFNLGPDYGRIPEIVLKQPWVLFTGSAPYLIGLLLIWKMGKSWLTASFLVGVAALLPVLGFIPFQFQNISTVADRYLYIALLGPAMAAAWLFPKVPNAMVRAGFWGLLLLCAAAMVPSLYPWQNSLSLNRHAVGINPESHDSWLRLGVIYSEEDRHRKAVDAFRQALVVKSDSAQANYNLALEYVVLKDVEKTVMHLKRAVALDPLFFEAYAKLGAVLYDLGWDDEAAAALQKALSLNPAYLEGALRLGALYLAWGQHEDAARLFQQAVDLDEGSVRAYLGLARAYNRLDKKSLAMKAYRRLLVLQPDSAVNWDNFGMLLEEQGEKDQAMIAYQKAVSIDPEFMEAKKSLAFLHLQQNASEQAAALLQQVVASRPDDPEAYMYLGLATFENGDAQQSLVWLKKSVAVDPAYAPAYLHLARLYLRMGRYREAIRNADKAKVLGLQDEQLMAALAPHRQN